ncbi:unnamed protein product [Caenorhabditis auriculariae]|uniref:Uncharacterized protein n=1 Tax=Caenorhabditis auriculariae TaxID=2777116 RepID=A0A8S1H5W9_9PELO|nr:unnamed protein product [Caenorhabditis auriculariae]
MDTSYQDEANASQRPDRPDPPQPTQSIPMSYYSADATTMAIEGRRTETPREEWNVYPERNRSDVSQNLTEAVNFIDNDTNLDVDDGEEEGKVEEMVASPEGNPAISRAETWITMRKRKAGESRSAQPPKASSHAESWITMRKHKAGESRSAQPPKNTMADEVHRAEARRDEEDFCTVQHEGEQAQSDPVRLGLFRFGMSDSKLRPQQRSVDRKAEAVNGDLNVKDEDVEEARKVEEQVKSPEANPAVSNPGSWITARKRKAGDTRSAQPPKRQFPGPTECKERAEELEQVGHEEEPWVEEGSQDGEELRRPEEGNLNVDGSPEEQVLDDLEEVPAEFEDFDDSDETSSSRATDELVADIRLLFELEADEEFDVDEDEEDSEDESEDSFFLSERRLRRFAAAALERVAREDVNGDEDGVEAGEAVPVEEPEAEEGEAEGEAVDDAQQTVPVAVAAGQPPSPAPAAAAPVAPAQAGPAPPAHQAAAPAGGPMRRRGGSPARLSPPPQAPRSPEISEAVAGLPPDSGNASGGTQGRALQESRWGHGRPGARIDRAPWSGHDDAQELGRREAVHAGPTGKAPKEGRQWLLKVAPTNAYSLKSRKRAVL